ncbi:MAG: OmpA family protein [Bacteroidaceae bacterium]|nr:OmpA family protein [Bacteroidaceae bacterium]
MKKLFLIAAMAVSALSASAIDGYKASKVTDNMYISLQGGVYEPLMGQDILGDARPVVRLSVNKYFNTVMGVSLYGEAFINNNNNRNSFTTTNFGPGQKTVVDFTHFGANALVNLSNLFCGYKGQPRFFEVVAEAGIGAAKIFGTGDEKCNFSTTNFALDFNFNLNNKWQINLRPAVEFQHDYATYNDHFYYLNGQQALATLTAGVSYNLGDVFTAIVPRDQAEIDGLNAKINGLRGELDGKNAALKAAQAEIDALKNKLKTAAAQPAPVVEAKDNSILQPSVIYRVGKSVIDPAQMAQVEMVAKYMKNHPDAKILVEGYASPEGDAAKNQALSEARANAVKTALVNKYKIAADRITAKGCGVTDKLFDEYDFNRVAIFKDTTK